MPSASAELLGGSAESHGESRSTPTQETSEYNLFAHDVPIEVARTRSCQQSMDEILRLLDSLETRLDATADGVVECVCRGGDHVELELVDRLCLRDAARELRERATRVAMAAEKLSFAVPRKPAEGRRETSHQTHDSASGSSAENTLPTAPIYGPSAPPISPQQGCTRKFRSPKIP